jgi:hypothetical protein
LFEFFLLGIKRKNAPAKYIVGKKPCQPLHIVHIDTTIYNALYNLHPK